MFIILMDLLCVCLKFPLIKVFHRMTRLGSLPGTW